MNHGLMIDNTRPLSGPLYINQKKKIMKMNEMKKLMADNLSCFRRMTHVFPFVGVRRYRSNPSIYKNTKIA